MLASAPAASAGGSEGREDEAGGRAAHEIDERCARRDIAANHAEGFGEGALDHGNPVHQTLALGHAAAPLPIHPDRVNLVEIGHRAMPLGDLAQFGDRSDVAIHRIDRFEADELRAGRVGLPQQAVEISGIAMREDAFLGAAVADPRNHRGVVPGIRKDDAAGNLARQASPAPYRSRHSRT